MYTYASQGVSSNGKKGLKYSIDSPFQSPGSVNSEYCSLR